MVPQLQGTFQQHLVNSLVGSYSSLGIILHGDPIRLDTNQTHVLVPRPSYFLVLSYLCVLVFMYILTKGSQFAFSYFVYSTCMASFSGLATTLIR